MVGRFHTWLDQYVLPWPVRWLTNRFVILATMILLVPLLVWADNTIFVLAVNSYLNIMSVAVSSIVLLYATIAEARDRQTITLREQRAQEDHTHVLEMNQLIIQQLQAQHEELAVLRAM